jgi:predicted kinase
MPELVLIRGLPGSGKSTLAKEMFPKHKHFEADMYFTDAEGNYNYDPAKAKDAHQWCLAMTKVNLEHGYDVVVSNTFTQAWELDAYFELKIPLKIYKATGAFESIHGVPVEVIQKMKDRFEDIPSEVWLKGGGTEAA